MALCDISLQPLPDGFKQSAIVDKMRFISNGNPEGSIGDGVPGRTMQVIGAGLPRCATSSLQAAFESEYLDMGPCMHMARVAPYADRLQHVLECMRERNREKRHKMLHQLFDGYSATCDFPGIMFIDDLMDMYPDAAIVLNQRSSGPVWQKSFRDSLSFFTKRIYLSICFLWKTDRLHWRCHHEAPDLWEEKMGERSLLSPTVYDSYNNWVREEARKRDRPVLEFQASDGYPALCKFLGKPLPPVDVKFPHLNDAANMRLVKRILVIRGLVSWVALGASAWAAWKYGPGLVQSALSAGKSWLSK